jgi:predicted translin family RNA/ssDNA-binding protein
LTCGRIRQVNQPIPKDLHKPKEWDTIRNAYGSIGADLQGLNAYRYSNNITGGNQELMEAMAFQHYLETQRLMSIEEARNKLHSLSAGNEKVMLTEADYVLGIFDMVGELMRFAITSMATGGQIVAPRLDDGMDVDEVTPRSVLADLWELRSYLELLDASGSSLAREFGKKMGVMQECVEKVEKASYGQIVRGSERPKGWVPDFDERREEIEVS